VWACAQAQAKALARVRVRALARALARALVKALVRSRVQVQVPVRARAMVWRWSGLWEGEQQSRWGLRGTGKALQEGWSVRLEAWQWGWQAQVRL
jgi:hypothetical protein